MQGEDWAFCLFVVRASVCLFVYVPRFLFGSLVGAGNVRSSAGLREGRGCGGGLGERGYWQIGEQGNEYADCAARTGLVGSI